MKKSNKNNNSILEQLMDEPCEKKYFNQCKIIWKNYVPKRGQSDVLQGELLRRIERLRYEAQDNGNINWDEDFSFFCDFLKETLCAQEIYTDEEKEKYKLILDYLKDCGNYAADVRDSKISDEKVEMERIAYVDNNLYDIIADAIGKFNVFYPEPIYIELNDTLSI